MEGQNRMRNDVGGVTGGVEAECGDSRSLDGVVEAGGHGFHRGAVKRAQVAGADKGQGRAIEARGRRDQLHLTLGRLVTRCTQRLAHMVGGGGIEGRKAGAGGVALAQNHRVNGILGSGGGKRDLHGKLRKFVTIGLAGLCANSATG